MSKKSSNSKNKSTTYKSPYSAIEVAELLQLTPSGITYLIKKFNLIDNIEIIQKSRFYIISEKGLNIIKEHQKK